ncbi:DUF1501 domain-containing protein [Roseimaritima ulvae]|uniref:DUF1501 domain-containing protein n=1 Tax=Roseimaritima ulvae TaxID=980254 RepID=A0A5B9QV79_9BACT|nr:DUF1501 domain-containing protein [Roseimaritima ulvae]QEG42934.1 hypothetical protein UC8_49760 [Roseimaritima ulvae]
MTTHKTCDGVLRRDVLRAGALGAGGLTLGGYLRMAQAGQVRPSGAKSAIFIELPGGPSHLDTFDLKPNAGDEFRGSFKPISTNVPGIQISEHLPKLAACTDKYAILRGVSHTLAAHALGREYVCTGSRPLASLEYPSYGAVMSMQSPSIAQLPSNVAIPRSSHGAGFLGIRYSALNTNTAPAAGRPFSVRGVSLSRGVTVEQVQRRQDLLQDLDQRFAGLDQSNQLIDGLDEFSQQAHALITSPKARQAFDISKEPASFAAQFGEDSFGLSCLLALRLVESGVRFVTVQLGGWDTHQDNFTKLSTNLLPKLDAGLSGLFTGLEQRGLLDSTAVLATGEFGRTPKINSRSAEGGRDHYPRCMFMLMAGGGVRGGQVVGESDATAAGPAHEAITPDDVAASFYHNLGIDPQLEFQTETGRPITLVRDGKVIPQLFS